MRSPYTPTEGSPYSPQIEKACEQEPRPSAAKKKKKPNYSGVSWLPSVSLNLKFVVQLLSCVRLCVTPWTVARQAPLSMGFSRQEYYSGLPLPSQGDLPNLETEPSSPESSELAGGFFTTEPLGKTTKNLKQPSYLTVGKKAFLCKIGKKTRISVLTTYIQYVLEVLVCAIQQ